MQAFSAYSTLARKEEYVEAVIVFKHKHNHWVYNLVCRPSQLIQHLQEKWVAAVIVFKHKHNHWIYNLVCMQVFSASSTLARKKCELRPDQCYDVANVKDTVYDTVWTLWQLMPICPTQVVQAYVPHGHVAQVGGMGASCQKVQTVSWTV